MAYKQTLSEEDAAANPGAKRERHVASNISSNMAGPSRAGDIAADKRMNLLHAQGEPRVGRREDDPEPEAPWYKRKEFFLGTFLGLVVVVCVLVLLMVLSNVVK